MRTSPPSYRGFSLIELLVVMAIIGIIAAFVVPNAAGILRGSQMTQGSQILTDQISLARQSSIARNHPIEVRFVRFVDPETPSDTGLDGNAGNYHAIWLYEILDSGVAVPLDKPALLPLSVIFNPSITFSPILASQTSYPKSIQPSTTDPQTYPRTSAQHPNGVSYTYTPFRYYPDGSTSLYSQGYSVKGLWFVTLQNVNDRPTTAPPPNFFTLSIDPFTGLVKTYRPGV